MENVTTIASWIHPTTISLDACWRRIASRTRPGRGGRPCRGGVSRCIGNRRRMLDPARRLPALPSVHDRPRPFNHRLPAHPGVWAHPAPPDRLTLVVPVIRRGAGRRRTGLQPLDEGDDQSALSDHGAEHPFQEVGLEVRDVGPGCLPQSVDVPLDDRDVGLGFVLQSRDVPLDATMSALVARLLLSRATCSFARASACSSVNPCSVRRLTN